MTKKTVLTRRELERAAIWMQLNDRYEAVMFIQKNNTGIGVTTWARFFNPSTPDRYEEIDITDLESW
jgi:hypothetical protein